MTVLVAHASVALHVERLTKSKVLSVVNAFADLVLRDDLSGFAEVLLALVGGFPDGAGHFHAAEGFHGSGAIRRRPRSRLALVVQVTLNLASDFADAVATVVF